MHTRLQGAYIGPLTRSAPRLGSTSQREGPAAGAAGAWNGPEGGRLAFHGAAPQAGSGARRLGCTGWPAAASLGKMPWSHENKACLCSLSGQIRRGSQILRARAAPAAGAKPARWEGSAPLPGREPIRGGASAFLVYFQILSMGLYLKTLDLGFRTGCRGGRGQHQTQARPGALSPAHPPAQGRRPGPPVAVICPRAGSTQLGAQGHAE